VDVRAHEVLLGAELKWAVGVMRERGSRHRGEKEAAINRAR
jgi:hypothetical protein